MLLVLLLLLLLLLGCCCLAAAPSYLVAVGGRSVYVAFMGTKQVGALAYLTTCQAVCVGREGFATVHMLTAAAAAWLCVRMSTRV
jgi:hypothetical protein